MAVCASCGYSKTPDGKSSCYQCGRPLDVVEAAPVGAAPVAPADAPADAPAALTQPAAAPIAAPAPVAPTDAPPAWTQPAPATAPVAAARRRLRSRRSGLSPRRLRWPARVADTPRHHPASDPASTAASLSMRPRFRLRPQRLRTLWLRPSLLRRGHSPRRGGSGSDLDASRDGVAPTPAPAPVAPVWTQPAAAPVACPSCGYAKTPPGKRSCFNCGKPLDAAAIPAAPAAAPYPVAPTWTPPATAPIAPTWTQPAPVVAAPAPAPVAPSWTPPAAAPIAAPAPVAPVWTQPAAAPVACPSCGYAKTPPGKRSCFNCGKPLDAAAIPAAPVAAPAPVAPTWTPPTRTARVGSDLDASRGGPDRADLDTARSGRSDLDPARGGSGSGRAGANSRTRGCGCGPGSGALDSDASGRPGRHGRVECPRPDATTRRPDSRKRGGRDRLYGRSLGASASRQRLARMGRRPPARQDLDGPGRVRTPTRPAQSMRRR